MADSKSQKITILVPIEDYGWISRYAAQNDLTPSQTIRKAIRMFIIANNVKKKQKREDGETSG